MYPCAALAILSLGLTGHAVAASAAELADMPVVSSNNPAIFQGNSFDGRRLDLAFNGKCVDIPFKQDIGSVYIPCKAQAPADKKNVCTLYANSGCDESDPNFESLDRSIHNAKDDRRSLRGLGILRKSVRCSAVDKSARVWEDDFSVGCAGDACKSDTDCTSKGLAYQFCSPRSGKCEPGKVIAQDGACYDDRQCRAGYCTGGLTCKAKRGKYDKCASSAECDTDQTSANRPMVCCRAYFDDHDSQPTCNEARSCYEEPRKCTGTGSWCWSSSACCSNSCQFGTLFPGFFCT